MGTLVGISVGFQLGCGVGRFDGIREGYWVGSAVWTLEGALVSPSTDGISVGSRLGVFVGFFVGPLDGFREGSSLGISVGARVGAKDRSAGAGGKVTSWARVSIGPVGLADGMIYSVVVVVGIRVVVVGGGSGQTSGDGISFRESPVHGSRNLWLNFRPHSIHDFVHHAPAHARVHARYPN